MTPPLLGAGAGFSSTSSDTCRRSTEVPARLGILLFAMQKNHRADKHSVTEQ